MNTQTENKRCYIHVLTWKEGEAIIDVGNVSNISYNRDTDQISVDNFKFTGSKSLFVNILNHMKKECGKDIKYVGK